MKRNGSRAETIRLSPDGGAIIILDQRFLPFDIRYEEIKTVCEMVTAIKDMHLRGAPLIGVAAAYGVYLAALKAQSESEAGFENALTAGADALVASRPTAVNLKWSVSRMLRATRSAASIANKIITARAEADAISRESAAECQKIGEYGADIIEKLSRDKNGGRVNILTHCNAGRLACVDHGTATAPIYAAAKRGIDVHVYVDETRPRNQGAFLTAFELLESGVPHTLIADNAGGHLMCHGLVDIVIVGSDRTTARGDTANKIGTYLKALAASDNNIPFYVALPTSTIDMDINDGFSEIPIEKRFEDEVKYITGLSESGKRETVLIAPKESPAENHGFDVTPSRLITALITEKGICPATKDGIDTLKINMKTEN